jgi:proteasome alpha subunit
VGLQLREALRVAVGALTGSDRELVPDDLEVAVLSRDGERRSFRRIEGDDLGELLG